MRDAIRGHQGPSEAISEPSRLEAEACSNPTQRQSGAVRGNQRHSVSLRTWRPKRAAIPLRGNQGPSEAIRGNQ
jgi:hypothetical protein